MVSPLRDQNRHLMLVKRKLKRKATIRATTAFWESVSTRLIGSAFSNLSFRPIYLLLYSKSLVINSLCKIFSEERNFIQTFLLDKTVLVTQENFPFCFKYASFEGFLIKKYEGITGSFFVFSQTSDCFYQ